LNHKELIKLIQQGESEKLEFKNNYQAHTRNKLIAEAFYLTGDIEKYGSGFVRIREEIKAYPTMKLDLEEVPNGFLVTLRYVQQKSLFATNKLKVTDNVTDNVTESRLTLILNLIQNNPQLTTEKIAEKLKLTKRTILRDIDKLKTNNKIMYVGSAKTGYWKILNE